MGRALVVGASSAIGSAIAVGLAEDGYNLVLCGRDRERLDAAAAAVTARGRGCITERVDVRDDDAMAAALAAADAAGQSTEPVAVVVWAAGVFDWGDAAAADHLRWREVVEVNLTAAAAFTAIVLPGLVAAAPAALVYIGSGARRRAYPHNAAHVASKHGLAGLAAATFLDVRDRGVKVSLVSPGMVAAGASLLSPAAARPEDLLQPDDVARAVRFVVSFPLRGCPVEIDLQPQRTPAG